MTDWTSGYVADIGYTYGYYSELNPLRIRTAFLNAGLTYPETGSACELGFGQGLSVNLHAAAGATQWFGTDFNPSQAAFARELASASSSGAALCDQAFSEFCTRPDLPDFDFIGLHGIWSWVSDENRTIIVDFIRRKLKVGGVLYVSYNTQPGWAVTVPLRDLLVEHSQVMATPAAGVVSSIDSALEFAERLLATNPMYARANPQVAERLKMLKGQDRHYLAHEYFNRDWHPMSFARMAEWLAPAKLSFACSAQYIDHIDSLNLTNDQQRLLKEIPDVAFRELLRDFCVNQQFRRDYWVKGQRKLNRLEQVERLRAQRVVLTRPRSEVSLKVIGNLGEATMQESVYGEILDVLGDYEPKTVGQIEQCVRAKDIKLPQVLQAVTVLTGTGALYAAQEESSVADSKCKSEKLNSYLCKQARGGGEINYLACPVTGGGIGVSRIAQLFLLARSEGLRKPEEWASFALNTFTQQGQRVLKDGKVVEDKKESLVEVTSQAELFAEKQLPILQALQIA